MKFRAVFLFAIFLISVLVGTVIIVSIFSFKIIRRYSLFTKVKIENRGNKTYVLDESFPPGTLLVRMNSSRQSVYLVSVNHPGKISYDEDGNFLYLFEGPVYLEPNKTFSFITEFSIEIHEVRLPDISLTKSETLDDIPKELKENFCVGSDFFLIDEPKLRSIAFEVAGNKTNVLEIGLGLTRWIDENIEFGGIGRAQYPNETVENGVGMCFDQSVLFITFCRILGIPAYLEGICWYEGGAEFKDTQHEGHQTVEQVGLKQVGHGYAQAYIPPWGWLPIDVSIQVGTPIDHVTKAHVLEPNAIQMFRFKGNLLPWLRPEGVEERIWELYEYNLFVYVFVKMSLLKVDNSYVTIYGIAASLCIVDTVAYVIIKRKRIL